MLFRLVVFVTTTREVTALLVGASASLRRADARRRRPAGGGRGGRTDRYKLLRKSPRDGIKGLRRNCYLIELWTENYSDYLMLYRWPPTGQRRGVILYKRSRVFINELQFAESSPEGQGEKNVELEKESLLCQRNSPGSSPKNIYNVKYRYIYEEMLGWVDGKTKTN